MSEYQYYQFWYILGAIMTFGFALKFVKANPQKPWTYLVKFFIIIFIMIIWPISIMYMLADVLMSIAEGTWWNK